MVNKAFNTLEIFFFSIVLILCSCNTNDEKKRNEDYKKNIVGTWQEISSKTPGFKMTDSTMIIIDTALANTPFFGQESKYNIIGDTLCVTVNDEQTSKEKIVVLTSDSLVTAGKDYIKRFFRVK